MAALSHGFFFEFRRRSGSDPAEKEAEGGAEVVARSNHEGMAGTEEGPMAMTMAWAARRSRTPSGRTESITKPRRGPSPCTWIRPYVTEVTVVCSTRGTG